MKDYKQEFLDYVNLRDKSFHSSAKIQPTMIKLNGKIYRTEKGKTLWKNPGHAKLALRNDISSYFFYKQFRNGLLAEEAKRIERELVESAEFISIDFTPEMLGNLKF